jgi:hypothetical protein
MAPLVGFRAVLKEEGNQKAEIEVFMVVSFLVRV